MPFSILIFGDGAAASAPGLGSALVKICYQALDVGQLVVQILAALLLHMVIGAVLENTHTLTQTPTA